jgi:hypothetical protein
VRGGKITLFARQTHASQNLNRQTLDIGRADEKATIAQPGMVETNPGAQVPSPGAAAKSTGSGGRQRVISSCLTCRRRKVKCDHAHPICGACTRGNHVCTWSDQVTPQPGAGRISKPILAKSSDVQSRLDRLELLLEKAVTGQGPRRPVHGRPHSDSDVKDYDPNTPSATSQTSHSAGMADDGDGTLLLDGGQSQFVSSLHYALLAEEVSAARPFLLPISRRHFDADSSPDTRHQSPSWRQVR